MFGCSMSETMDTLDLGFHVFTYSEKENKSWKTVCSVFFWKSSFLDSYSSIPPGNMGATLTEDLLN